ncbi:hypothetical protein HUW63_15180 [Myxococcus sp. AM001]|nr:hypothetical protein [Myxococcus sp. AM001]
MALPRELFSGLLQLGEVEVLDCALFEMPAAEGAQWVDDEMKVHGKYAVVQGGNPVVTR